MGKKRILVTGSNGFIGSNLVRFLSRKNEYEVFATSRNQSDHSTLDDSFFFQVDLTNKNVTNELIRYLKPDIVCNLAAKTRFNKEISNIEEMINANIMTFLNIVTSILENNISIEVFLQVGSTEEYGSMSSEVIDESFVIDPISIYSGTKSAISLLCKSIARVYKVPIVIARLSLVYGPKQDQSFFIPQAIQALKAGQTFKMTLGEQVRDFIYIDDVTSALFELIRNKNCYGETFNISYGESTKLKDVIKVIKELTNSNSTIKLGSFPYRENELFDVSYDNKKMRTYTNWKPSISLYEGIRRTIKS
jgi:nucleoside-diphosphate-sugar epimerase